MTALYIPVLERREAQDPLLWGAPFRKGKPTKEGNIMQSFDRVGDWRQGYEDAKNGFQRESTRPMYRQGYDRGLSESIREHKTNEKHETT